MLANMTKKVICNKEIRMRKTKNPISLLKNTHNKHVTWKNKVT